jgi:hypothetical protein
MLTRGELTQFVLVVLLLLLDRTCPLQSSGLRTQVVSIGLPIEMLKGNWEALY